MILSQLAVVTDTAGLKVFSEIPIRSKSIGQYEMVLDYIIDVIPCGQEVNVLERAKGFNDTEWGFIEWIYLYYETDEDTISKEACVNGWILLKFKDHYFVEFVYEDEREEEINSIFGFQLFLYGQSMDVIAEINTTTDFRWIGIIFIAALIIELFIVSLKIINIKRKSIVVIVLWFMTAMAFGYGRLSDIALIITGSLK
jgi:hypothetical protein